MVLNRLIDLNEIRGQLGLIAIIGGGRMGEAIVSGLVQGAFFADESIVVANPSQGRRDYLSERYGLRCYADGSEIKHPNTAILAVKPQKLREVAAGLAAAEDFDPQRVISIAAGVSTATVQGYFPGAAVVRVMPNVALSVSAGMSVVAAAVGVSARETELVRKLFFCMGDALVIEESQIDAATAVSGSGPAYFALLAEELTAAGVAAGLCPEVSERLARQTIIGTGRYLDLMDVRPEELRRSVTSPNGTTQAALEAFSAGGLGALVHEAFQACVRRAKELT